MGTSGRQPFLKTRPDTRRFGLFQCCLSSCYFFLNAATRFCQSAFGRLLFLLLCCAAPLQAQPAHSELEYRIKAAYLYNLSKFIQWPGETANSSAPIHICLFSSNPFKDYIYKLEERKARGRPIKIVENPGSDVLNDCEMVFVPFNADKTDTFLASLTNGNILTVGESEVFIRQGGLINLNLENGRVQLSINNSKAKQSGFVISANLLEIARQVD